MRLPSPCLPRLLQRGGRMLRRWGVAALAAAVCAGMAGGGAPEAKAAGSGVAAPAETGTLRFGLNQEPDRLDPAFSRTYAGRVVLTQLCERLYDLDSAGQPQPQLAAGFPERSEEGQVYLIRIKPNLRFNDGTPVNAAAVKASLDRNLNQKGSRRRRELEPLAGVEVVDPHTVRLRLDRPYAPLLTVLSDRAGMIVSRAQTNRLGDRFESDPVCVGPWSFVERVPGKRIVLARSPYFSAAATNGAATNGTARTSVRRIIFLPIPDSAQRLAALRNGEVDVINAVPALDIAQLRTDPRFGILQVLGPGYVGITFNIANRSGKTAEPASLGTPWSQQPKVREAFELALDREALNRKALAGEYVPGCTPISPATPFHPKGLKCSVRNLPAARRLLAEAGYGGGLSLVLTLVDDPVQVRVGEVIQAMEKEAGIRVRLKPVPFPEAIARQERGQFDALLLGFAGRLDPDSVIFPFHTCRGVLNFSMFCDPDLDRLLTEAQEELDPAERLHLYAEAVGKLSQSRSIVYLYHQKYTAAFSRRVTGLEAPPDGLMRLSGVRLDGPHVEPKPAPTPSRRASK